jgi:hypothetical protein
VQASGPDLHTVAAAGSCLQSVRGEAHSSHIRSEGEESGEVRRGKVCMSQWSGVECGVTAEYVDEGMMTGGQRP